MRTGTKFEMRRVEELHPYEHNARVHSDEQIEKLRSSFREFGFLAPLLIDGSGNVIAGHGRLQAALAEGIGEVPCVLVEHLTEEQQRAYIIADNRLTELGEWDDVLLAEELHALTEGGFDLSLTGWEEGDFVLDDGMEEALQNARENGERSEEYDAFEEKFKPKLTTDDCFTPPAVYEAVRKWAVAEYGWQGRKILRPFRPGGDYTTEEYPKGCVVIDNPPFSILSDVCRFYDEKGVDYFLFAPALTAFSARAAKGYVIPGVRITYDNGAVVNTGFVCSRGPLIRTAPDLRRIMYDAVGMEEGDDERTVYSYPTNVITCGKLDVWARAGVEYRSDRGEFVRALDAQRAVGKAVFGGGMIVPRTEANRAAAAAVAAQTARAEGSFVWELSEREMAIVAELEGGAPDGHAP